MLLVEQLLRVLLQLLVDRVELGRLLVDAGEFGFVLADLVVELGDLLGQLRDLLQLLVVSQARLRLPLHEPLLLALVRLDVGVELHALGVDLLLLSPQLVHAPLDPHVLFSEALLRFLVLLALLLEVVDDLLVAL